MPHSSRPAPTGAAVRFLNNTAGQAALVANGTTLFARVEAGAVTPYAELDGASVTFRLDGPSDPVTVTQRVEDGARYTVTAREAPQSAATLSLAREADSIPAAAEH